MKKSIYLFLGALMIVGISLWDYFALRMLEGVSKTVEEQQLFPGIFGAVLLLVSPLFEKKYVQITYV